MPSFLFAQNYEDIFNNFVNQNKKQFDSFSDSINRQFAETLVANMKSFIGEAPKEKDVKPKPIKQPEYSKDDDTLNKIPLIRPEELSKDTTPEVIPDTIQEETQKPTQPQISENLNNVSFFIFGEYICIGVKSFTAELKSIRAKDVSDFWVQLTKCDYDTLLQTCLIARELWAYNDWAIFQLILQITQQIFPNQYNEQAIFAVFLLNQLGLEAKVGFCQSHLFILLAIQQQIYGISFCDISNYRYYIVENNPQFNTRKQAFPFQTYDVAFPKKTYSFDMNVKKPIKNHTKNNINDRDTIINISMSMIRLFETYPQVDIEVYANASPSKEFCTSVEGVIKPFLKNLSEYDAVLLLLRYLQYGFDYATDDEQFGFEKPFFYEENYYYLNNDCEDRAVLFSFLVRYLLDLDVVLIDYPGHMATAVHFKNDYQGESVVYCGEKYIICDPTYIGASIGVEMPDFSPKDRVIIPIKR